MYSAIVVTAAEILLSAYSHYNRVAALRQHFLLHPLETLKEISEERVYEESILYNAGVEFFNYLYVKQKLSDTDMRNVYRYIRQKTGTSLVSGEKMEECLKDKFPF